MKKVTILAAGMGLIAGTVFAEAPLPQTPAELHTLWEAAFNAKDLDRLCALYAEDAVVQRQDGSAAVGREQFCADLGQLFGFAQSISFETAWVLEGTDTAVMRSEYVFTITAEDGSEQQLPGSGIEVVERQSDGSWLITVDHPSGGN
ncbi:MAG: YybH family protein [Halocynthiibacter sp.]